MDKQQQKPYGGRERRKYPRLQASVVEYVPIDNPPARETSFTEDIGGGGICILATEQLEKDTRLMLKVYLPQSKEPIEATGRVVWSHRSSFMGGHARSSFDTGVEFIDISDENRLRIQEYVERFSS